MTWIDAILSSQLTPITISVLAAAAVIFMFAKGWILTPGQVAALTESQNLRIAEAALRVSEANDRADDYRDLYHVKVEQVKVLTEQLAIMVPLGESLNRFLDSLPDPRQQQEEG